MYFVKVSKINERTSFIDVRSKSDEHMIQTKTFLYFLDEDWEFFFFEGGIIHTTVFNPLSWTF